MLLWGLCYAREPSAIAAGLLPSKEKLCSGWMKHHKRWNRKHLCLSQFHRETLQDPSHKLLSILLIVEIQWSSVLCYWAQEYQQLLLFLIIGLNPFGFFFKCFFSLSPTPFLVGALLAVYRDNFWHWIRNHFCQDTGTKGLNLGWLLARQVLYPLYFHPRLVYFFI